MRSTVIFQITHCEQRVECERSLQAPPTIIADVCPCFPSRTFGFSLHSSKRPIIHFAASPFSSFLFPPPFSFRMVVHHPNENENPVWPSVDTDEDRTTATNHKHDDSSWSVQNFVPTNSFLGNGNNVCGCVWGGN
jgi:hypothetical protein